ncbi:MAG: pimeloyl-CoA dehydrogenase large subunit [Gammaproteobacteria bacterium]|nr:MAG: pimeloyl-CoA dehydrogenase large subunit [Gammaproteobacteria bacterium]
MDTSYSPEEQAFKQEVTDWFETNLTPDLIAAAEAGADLGGAITLEQAVGWSKKLAAKGWTAPSWPKAYGGPGWSATQLYIFNSVRAELGAPAPFSMGVAMLGPALMKFGTPEQKEKYLPQILSSEDWWCQGYSEPGAGSDLASLKLAAVSDGDDYVLNGSKIWTTSAHHANRMFCLVRTNADGKKQEGISFILLDMDSPGLDIRPIISIDGEHHLNQVFFDDVRVPKANLIGEEGQGWTVAKYLLTHERSSISGVAEATANIKRIRRIACEHGYEDDLQMQLKIASADLELTALKYTESRMLSGLESGQVPGAESSMLKIKGTELQQDIAELRVDMAGHYAYPWQDAAEVRPFDFRWATQVYNFGRAATIYGGSTEVQYGVLAKMVLGL